MFRSTLGQTTYTFESLRELLAKASPLRSGDELAGVAATSAEERVAAQMALADVPLRQFLDEPIVPYDDDEVTRLIADTHDNDAFSPVSSLTVGEFRDWLLRHETDTATLAALAPGLTPEMVAAVSKLMRNQDLVLAAKKCSVVTRFRNTIGLPGRLAIRLQPNHPTDDPHGIVASTLDGLMYGCGDAVIGINPATDNVNVCVGLVEMLARLIERFEIPTQSCVLAHVTTTMEAMARRAPVDLVFQSIAGTELANKSFGISLAMLDEARQMALALGRAAKRVAGSSGVQLGPESDRVAGSSGVQLGPEPTEPNVMYFETGQGSCLSADAHLGCDQQTLEARAYAVARRFRPLLVNTVVGFIGPEYLYDGKQIVRAGLEDHFCGKLLGVPMGCDVCYTNHARADQDDMDTLLTLLAVAGCNYFMGVPGADDIMLQYQSTSFHDANYLRQVLGLRPAPEFEAWLHKMQITDADNRLLQPDPAHQLLTFDPH